MDVWYFSRDGEEKIGPASGHDLRRWVASGELAADALVWCPSMVDWARVDEVEGLGCESKPAPALVSVEEDGPVDLNEVATEPMGGSRPERIATDSGIAAGGIRDHAPRETVESTAARSVGKMLGALTIWFQFLGALLSLPGSRGSASRTAEKPRRRRFASPLEWLREALNVRSLRRFLKSKAGALFGGGGVLWLGAKFAALPILVSSGVTAISEGYGVDLTVDNWSVQLHDLTATAHDVAIRVPGTFAQEELLTARSIELDLSIWRKLRKGHWISEVRFNEPKVYLERTLSGRWNYDGLLPPRRRAQSQEVAFAVLSGARPTGDLEQLREFVVPSLKLQGLDLEWVEQLPANSRDGVIEKLTGSVFFDDVTVDVSDIMGIVDPDPLRDSTIGVEARTGSGRISFNGEANMFYWLLSRGGSQEARWMPSMEASVYLENVGVNTFARMVPDASLVPQSGSMGGTIKVDLHEQRILCDADLEVRNASFSVNQASRLPASQSPQLRSELASYRGDGRYVFECGASGSGEKFRFFHALHTDIVRQSLQKASDDVEALAAIEHARFSDEPIEPRLVADVQRMLGGADDDWLEWVDLGIRVERRLPARGIFSRLPGI